VQTNPGIVYQFGPFEVTPASGELLKNGRRIRLQELPHRLLVALLEKPGEVISREELRGRLWPDDTFVDFDTSLRVAVGKLREALDDSAEDPRYVETIPKRGYRFLVTEVRRLEPTPEVAEPFNDPEPLQTTSTQVASTQSRTSPLKYGIAVVTTIILLASGLFFWHQRTQTAPLTDKDVLVLADFANTTGDPVFDGTLRQGLSAQMEQSPFLNLVSDQRTAQTLSLMGQPKDGRLTHELAQEVCQRTASAAVLDGSIAQIVSLVEKHHVLVRNLGLLSR